MCTRVGAVTYLNTKPLVHKLHRYLADAELSFDLPSRLADQLAAGTLDVALIPAVESFQDPSYTIVSDACIACRGPVMSVKLYSRCPPESIRSLSLDEGSRTSAALVQVFLRDRYDVAPETVSLPIGLGLADADTDAVLLIGDRAIHAKHDAFPWEWDLGEAWNQHTQLPFVFAMWTVRSAADVDMERLAHAFSRARDAGLRALPELATGHAASVGIDPGSCLTYFRENLHFRLGPPERQGLLKFFRAASRMGLIPSAHIPRFHANAL